MRIQIRRTIACTNESNRRQASRPFAQNSYNLPFVRGCQTITVCDGEAVNEKDKEKLDGIDS